MKLGDLKPGDKFTFADVASNASLGREAMAAGYTVAGMMGSVMVTTTDGSSFSITREVNVVEDIVPKYRDTYVAPLPVLPVTEKPERPGDPRFHALLKEIADLHDLKQADYGTGEDPLANIRASELWGIPAWVGAMVRLNDKVKRLQSLRKKGSLANESAKDSFLDVAVYSLLAYILYTEVK
jgi:hypothetical protein